MAFFFIYKHHHLLIVMLLLVYIFRFKAQGRVILLSKSTDLEPSSHSQEEEEEEVKMMMMGSRRMVGSRPPKCERSCGSCGPCQPVQVPIAPLLQLRGGHTNNNTHLHQSSSLVSHPTYNHDGITNYKPICWKCKCGNFIFNP